MSSTPTFTGERLLPTVLNELAVEHLARYAFALPFATGKNVLDLACGEGYGTALLSREAASVTGADIDGPSIEQANQKYRQPNIAFTKANAESLSFEDDKFDIVVSFETIEHVPHPGRMIAEIKRVMKAGGLLIISTPERRMYSETNGYQNPFHMNEFTAPEFETLLQTEFKHLKFFGQQALSGSLIQSLESEPDKKTRGATGNYKGIEQAPFLSAPTYLIALASDVEIPATNSLFFHGKSVAESTAQAYEATWAYRIGRALTAPARLLRKGRKH